METLNGKGGEEGALANALEVAAQHPSVQEACKIEELWQLVVKLVVAEGDIVVADSIHDASDIDSIRHCPEGAAGGEVAAGDEGDIVGVFETFLLEGSEASIAVDVAMDIVVEKNHDVVLCIEADREEKSQQCE